MRKKNLAAMLFTLIFLFAFSQTGHAAAGSTSVYLDGRALTLPENGQVQNVNGNVMIPIRVVAEELGFDVNWEKKTGTVTIQQPGTILTLAVNKTTATVNGSDVKLTAAPMLAKDTTLVPLRFVGEQMGLTVSWDNSKKAAYLLSPSSGSGSGSIDNPESGNESEQPGTPIEPENGGELASVTGISFVDNRLMIAVDKNVTPNIFTMNGPDRLVVDLPQTVFAESLATGQTMDSNQSGVMEVIDSPDVSRVRFALFSSDPWTVRVVLDLNRQVNYSLVNENDGLIIVDLNAEATAPWEGTDADDGLTTVVIDAGHGGKDPGASSITKKKEKDFNLAVALKVQQLLLEQGPSINVVMTRESDTYPTLQDRVKIAENADADIFISIHANSGSATATGVETYYTRSASAGLAKVMHKHLVESSGLPDRKVRTQSLHVTRETTMPAVLLECGYLSNKNDEALLYTEEFQNNVAQGIVDGIIEYLGVN
ncbi:N-acetylmuramoyl-L-alanine amidase family protein [Paenibacillus macerans]|uniref:N-acetylmuramoyl-L-alanine amidase family protein n=1 Tax=Paenibacillus macerans TaxID=44252 RepID=UPI002041C9B8|nr:N-acetylmuramoyl-L-alanine amidase family protein [Paenibacillus macerans]MCM3698067.1 N-acetylmuramoyl-L-alanine amidase family protein [Paenibacillus macerans]